MGNLSGGKSQDDSCYKKQKRARGRDVEPLCRGASAALCFFTVAGVNRLVSFFVKLVRAARQAIVFAGIVELTRRGGQRGRWGLDCLACRSTVRGEYLLTRGALHLSSRGLFWHAELTLTGGTSNQHKVTLYDFLLHHEEVRRQAVQGLGGFADGFAERRVRMNAERQVLRGGAHFDRNHAFRDQLAGAWTGGADAEDRIIFGIDQHFRDAV